MNKVRVLWEDQAAKGDIKEYGPHKLLVRQVADQAQLPAEQLGALHGSIESYPCNGNAKLLKKLSNAPWVPTVAVVDRDRVKELLEQNKRAVPGCISGQASEVVATAGCGTVILLKNRLEDILDLIRRLNSNLVPAETWTRALQKELLARDSVFLRASSNDGLRADLLRHNSWQRLVNEVHRAVFSDCA